MGVDEEMVAAGGVVDPEMDAHGESWLRKDPWDRAADTRKHLPRTPRWFLSVSVRKLEGVTWWDGLNELIRGTVSSPTRAAA